jgi:acetyl esterase/lipase
MNTLLKTCLILFSLAVSSHALAVTNKLDPALNADTPVADPAYADVLAQPFIAPSTKLVYGKHPDQHVLVWQQANEAPLVVFVHGGCWLDAYDINHAKPVMSTLYEHGYTVIGVEYRRATQAQPAWPMALIDIVAGLSFALSEVRYDMDVPVALLGHSAGGHLALLAAQRSAQWAPAQALHVHGLAAITDIVTYAGGDNSCQRATVQFMGGTPTSIPEAYQQALPAKLPAGDNVTQIRLWHGAADSIVPLAQSTYPTGHQTIIAGAGHFAWVHPNSTAFLQLLQQLP